MYEILEVIYPSTLKLHKKYFTQPFYVRRRLLPNPFPTNPSMNNERSLMEGKRLQVNSLLEKSLAGNQISFIRDKTLDQNWRYLLFEDGIHLNNKGTNVLVSSFVNYLNTM